MNQYGDKNNGCSGYNIDSLSSNFVKIIGLDTVQNTVKGIFEFKAKSPTCKQIVVITDGKFEVKYQ